MRSVVRWLLGGLVTVAAFTLVVWVCGALVLPSLLKDPGIRWGIAVGLGAAVASLAALWGQSFASRREASGRKVRQRPSASGPLRALR